MSHIHRHMPSQQIIIKFHSTPNKKLQSHRSPCQHQYGTKNQPKSHVCGTKSTIKYHWNIHPINGHQYQKGKEFHSRDLAKSLLLYAVAQLMQLLYQFDYIRKFTKFQQVERLEAVNKQIKDSIRRINNYENKMFGSPT